MAILKAFYFYINLGFQTLCNIFKSMSIFYIVYPSSAVNKDSD